jgi:hypothetical protein
MRRANAVANWFKWADPDKFVDTEIILDLCSCAPPDHCQ